MSSSALFDQLVDLEGQEGDQVVYDAAVSLAQSGKRVIVITPFGDRLRPVTDNALGDATSQRATLIRASRLPLVTVTTSTRVEENVYAPEETVQIDAVEVPLELALSAGTMLTGTGGFSPSRTHLATVMGFYASKTPVGQRCSAMGLFYEAISSAEIRLDGDTECYSWLTVLWKLALRGWGNTAIRPTSILTLSSPKDFWSRINIPVTIGNHDTTHPRNFSVILHPVIARAFADVFTRCALRFLTVKECSQGVPAERFLREPPSC